MNIQWYPGHMTKTRRQMEQDMRLVDAVCEIVDARIPEASRNPDLDSLCGEKPRLVVLNRTDLADPAYTKQWAAHYRSQGLAVLETDCKQGKGVGQFPAAVRGLLREKLKRFAAKGLTGRTVRAMVVGIPNVGKSTFINQISGRKSAKTENRPGVTRGKQWVTVERGLELLDTPGILWPKFDDERVGLCLAFTGAIKDTVVDTEALGAALMERLAEAYPAALTGRYRIEIPPDPKGYALLEAAGRRRGFLISGGEIDTERMAQVLLEEFRSGKLGRFTLETPPGKEARGHDGPLGD